MKALKSLGRFGLLRLSSPFFGAFAMLTALWSWWMAFPSVIFGILAVMGGVRPDPDQTFDPAQLSGAGTHAVFL